MGRPETCAAAAGGGHLTVLMCMREHGALWDELACALATEGGHLEVLPWLRSHGAPWDELIYRRCRMMAATTPTCIVCDECTLATKRYDM